MEFAFEEIDDDVSYKVSGTQTHIHERGEAD